MGPSLRDKLKWSTPVKALGVPGRIWGGSRSVGSRACLPSGFPRVEDASEWKGRRKSREGQRLRRVSGCSAEEGTHAATTVGADPRVCSFPRPESRPQIRWSGSSCGGLRANPPRLVATRWVAASEGPFSLRGSPRKRSPFKGVPGRAGAGGNVVAVSPATASSQPAPDVQWDYLLLTSPVDRGLGSRGWARIFRARTQTSANAWDGEAVTAGALSELGGGQSFHSDKENMAD
ncbi:unnamed protein product [Diplocarpon coronariae]